VDHSPGYAPDSRRGVGYHGLQNHVVPFPRRVPAGRDTVYDGCLGPKNWGSGENVVTTEWAYFLTSPQVFRLSTLGPPGPIGFNIFFLDEFRTVVPASYMGINPCELIVFDTLIPQGHPRSSRRFGLPPRYQNAHARIHADEERYLGTLDRDVPFITDPTQAIIAVELSGSGYHVLLIVRIQVLIEHACSRPTNTYVPWDEWGRGVAIMEISLTKHCPSIYVHGTHVVALKTVRSRDNQMESYFICSVDFGRRGCGALSLRDGEVCGIQFEDGKGLTVGAAGEGHMYLWGDVQSLGNGRFLKQASYFSYSDSNDVAG